MARSFTRRVTPPTAQGFTWGVLIGREAEYTEIRSPLPPSEDVVRQRFNLPPSTPVLVGCP